MRSIAKPIKAFIFDMDGVLTDTMEYHLQFWQQLAAELNIAFSRKDYDKLLGLSRPDSMKLFLQGRSTTAADFQHSAAYSLYIPITL